MTTKKYFTLLILLLSILSCKQSKTANQIDVLSSNRDTLISPSDNFFAYANGSWFKKNPIPNTEKNNGIFRTIQDTINNQIKNICEKSANEVSEKGSFKQKIGDFYLSGMDTIAIEKNGIDALLPEFYAIDNISTTETLLQTIAHLHTIGADPAFSFYVGQDDKISTKHALFFAQGGLGLNNRDYYFNTDPEAENIRNKYKVHLQKFAKYLTKDKVLTPQCAAKIFDLETNLASASRKIEDLRDPNKNYNKMAVSKFSSLTPTLPWKTALSMLQVPYADTIVVGQPEFFVNLDKLIKDKPLIDWKLYLKWNLMNTYAAYLNKEIETQNFTFYSGVMNGITTQKPRWKKVVEQTDASLGELIGQIYVKEYLPEGSKEKLLQIGENVKSVFASHIKKLDWMSDETKLKALSKLKKIVMKVGYPDKWKDMSSVIIDSKSYCNNVMAVNKWYYQYMLNKFGKPVDRNEWAMQPQTYNAYYNPSNNEIVVPACNILVPGYEGRMPDDAILYGIIGGSTFGHEMTHGFDDQGSKYDEKGNLNNWWTTEDLKKFNAKTKLIVAQFNKFEALPNKFVNGNATQGENIADLGGVIMGFEAFKKTVQYRENKKIGNLTTEQRYFLAYAYAWMVNIKKESLEQQLITDVHSPAQFRVNGPLSNIAEFHKAFKIKENSKMHRSKNEQIVIW